MTAHRTNSTKAPDMSTKPKLLGFQIANSRGENVQGDDEDPSGHPSHHVMDAAEAQRVLEEHPGWRLLLQPIYEGDIEEPTFD